MKKMIGFFLLSIMFSACSSIRMKYEGNLTTENGEKSKVTAEKSYNLGSIHATTCAITGVFLGGYCWYYFVFPTTSQRAQMEKDVNAAVRESLKTDKFSLVPTKNDRVSWDNKDDSLNIKLGDDSGFKNKNISR